MNTVIQTENLARTYQMATAVHALRGVSFSIEVGEYVAVMGASGSGKSTLMNLLGCLDKPTSGTYTLDGTDTSSLSSNEYANIRNQKIGFVFQGFNLIPRTTALDNVYLPLLYDRTSRLDNPLERAIGALESVGLSGRMTHDPNQLSGGEQQRVAVARAIVNDPAMVLADEPTGNLDTHTSIEIMSVFQKLNEMGRTIIMVTHERDIARYANRVIELRDGVILRDYPVRHHRNADDDLAHFAQLQSDLQMEEI